jgi:hypothetical protein
MVNPDFAMMSRAELRAFVVSNPQNQLALQAFVDLATTTASSETYDFPRSMICPI